MAVLIPRRIPHFKKPEVAHVNLGYDLLPDYLFIPELGRDADLITRDEVLLPSGYTRDISVGGRSWLSSATNVLGPDVSYISDTGGNYTFEFIFVPRAVKSSNPEYFIDSESGRIVLTLTGASSGGNDPSIYDGNWKTWTGVGNPTSGLQHYIYVLNGSDSTATLYINSVNKGDISYTAKNIGGTSRIFSRYISSPVSIPDTHLLFFGLHSRALSEGEAVARSNNRWDVLNPRRRWMPLVIEAGAGGVTIIADPLVATTSLDATPIINAQITADPLSVTGTLSAGVSTGVNVTAQPLAAATSLSADQHVSAAVTSDPLTAVTSLGATAQIGVNQAADPLTVTASLAGASIISVNQAADPLTATTSLSADIQAGAGVTINAQPLTATTSLSASPVIGVLQSADPIVVSGELLADAYVAVNVTADTLSAETSLFGTVQAAGGVQVSAAPLTLTSALTGQAITGVNIAAVPLSLIASLSASTIIGVNQSASPLTLTASLLGNVIAGAVIINTDAAETLHLTVEDPTLNLTAESPTLNLTP